VVVVARIVHISLSTKEGIKKLKNKFDKDDDSSIIKLVTVNTLYWRLT